MRYDSLSHFLRSAGPRVLAKGPIAIILVEDDVETDSTIRHHLKCGFKETLVLANNELFIDPNLEEQVHRVTWDMAQDHATPLAVNEIAAAAEGQWVYYCYNSEYLFYPFCEERSVGEMIGFNMEERRDTILSYVIDLYAGDLQAAPMAVSLKDAHLDKSGYYALARKDAWNNNLDRQMDFFGGLRWRFEEHIPKRRRKIDRVALFRAQKGVVLRDDHTFSEPEYNTFACPWHHNITASICSFRTAKALKRNPGSTFDIESFKWHNSTKFNWQARQLLDLGLMEPGQWF